MTPRALAGSPTLTAALALVLGVAAGCRHEAPANELTVFAAASLTDAFEAIAADFERQNPGIEVSLSFAGSQSLRTQIEHGAKPDVFASANREHVQALRTSGLVGEPSSFAENLLVIVVPKGNPSRITGLADLVRAERLVLAETSVPAGLYAAQVLANAELELGAGFAERVLDRVVSRELHVRQTLQKVLLGEADAAIVYATDAAAAASGVEVIEIPAKFNIVASYPVALVNGTPRSELAERFIDYLRSEPGTAALVRYGFRPAGVIAAGR